MSDSRLDLVTVGKAAGVFGVKGWVKIRSFTECPENIVTYTPWWLKTRHGVKSFEIDDHKIRGNDILVHFVGLDDRELAKDLLPADIAVERSLFGQLDDGEFYWHQLIGLKVVSEFESGRFQLGSVAKLMETGANDVLVVSADDSSIDGQERLIPYVPETYIKEVNIKEGTIVVDWDPEF